MTLTLICVTLLVSLTLHCVDQLAYIRATVCLCPAALYLSFGVQPIWTIAIIYTSAYFWLKFSKQKWRTVSVPACGFSIGGPATCRHCMLCLPRGHEKWLPQGVGERTSGLCAGNTWVCVLTGHRGANSVIAAWLTHQEMSNQFPPFLCNRAEKERRSWWNVLSFPIFS